MTTIGLDVTLRVHHFVDGRRIQRPSDVVHLLVPELSDRGHVAVPVASPAEVEEFLALAGEGLARWLAFGPKARSEIIAAVQRACVASTFQFAESLADDFGISCEQAVAAVTRDTEHVAAMLRDHRPARLPRGMHVVATGEQRSGEPFVDMIWPLLLDGSTVILRPTLAAPRTASLLAETASDAGLPDGVLSVIHGDRVTLDALVSSPLVAGCVGVGPALTDPESPVDGSVGRPRRHCRGS